MRFMLLVFRDDRHWESLSVEQKGAIYREAVDFHGDLRRKGVAEAGEPLEPARTAATVRMRNGTPIITDGPFAETKEQLGGYMIVEARDLDEAASIAARNPLVRAGLPIEVRPIRVGPPR